MDLIEGRANEHDLAPDPIDDDRESMLMLQEEWPDVFDQLPCSADHYACWACPPGRVVHCVQDWSDDVREYRNDIKRGYKRGTKRREPSVRDLRTVEGVQRGNRAKDR